MDFNIFFEVLKFTIPAIIVFLTSFLLIKHFLDADYRKRLMELKLDNKKLITPLRLQAYERLVLLLERISAGSIIMRVNKPGLTASQLQLLLIQTIREEFEHNISQQVYVSTPAWEVVRNAKEEMIKLVNTAASRLNDNATSTDLSQKLIELSIDRKKSFENEAIDFLKNEIRMIF